MMTTYAERSLPINFQGMRYAPENEQGVVFLFSKVAKRLGFPEIDIIQPQFPDCWVHRRTSSGVARTWIEFEFHSSGFKQHLTKHKGVFKKIRPKRGIVVCWEHNWKECEKYVEVIELKSLLGFGRQVWVQNTLPRYQEGLDNISKRQSRDNYWSVAPGARPGDLVLMYRAGTKSAARRFKSNDELLQSITNVFLVKSYPKRERKKESQAYSEVVQIAKLKKPLRLEHMRRDRILKSAPFVMVNMFGRNNVTSYWYRLYDLMLKLNPSKDVRKALKSYCPELL
jgi:hypothetical protein